MSSKRSSIILLCTGALLIALGGTAAANPTPVTKLGFHLDQHHLVVGDMVSANVSAMTRDGNHWVPIAGATISVRVDGVEVQSLVTDATGTATISWVADTPGGHVMRTIFAGDDLHKKAQRAQGFEVVPAPVPAS